MTRRVLVIDDEPDIRMLAQMSLELTGGWEVLTAGSGTEGLRIAADALPDAILLDAMMPALDGAGTMRELRLEPRTAEIPVVMLTARVMSSEQRAFMDLGARAVITKPFDPLSLAQTIRDALGWTS